MCSELRILILSLSQAFPLFLINCDIHWIEEYQLSLPVSSAFHMEGSESPKVLQKTRSIFRSCKIGWFSQRFPEGLGLWIILRCINVSEILTQKDQWKRKGKDASRSLIPTNQNPHHELLITSSKLMGRMHPFDAFPEARKEWRGKKTSQIILDFSKRWHELTTSSPRSLAALVLIALNPLMIAEINEP